MSLFLVDVHWIMFLVFVHHLPHLLSLTLQSWRKLVVNIIEELVYGGLGFVPRSMHGLLHLILSFALKIILKFLRKRQTCGVVCRSCDFAQGNVYSLPPIYYTSDNTSGTTV